MYSLSVTCQRCSQRLKFPCTAPSKDFTNQQSLTNQSNTRELNQKDLINLEYEKSIQNKVMIPLEMAESSSDFIMVGDLQSLMMDKNQSVKKLSVFEDITSDRSDVNIPLCGKCTDSLLDYMDQRMDDAQDECKRYSEFLRNLPEDSNQENLDMLMGELDVLQGEIGELQKELSDIGKKDKESKQLLGRLEREYEKLQREEDKQCKDLFHIQRKHLNYEDDRHSLDNQLLQAQAQLDRLNKSCVLNATFHIWHNGPFGTINNFRLGRLPNAPVEWSEINAAWGQTVLLLHSMAKKVDFTFVRYRLVPYGDHSYVESRESKSKDLPLYCLGGSKFMMDVKFDLAMVAFLDCLNQFKDHLEQMNVGHFRLPYQIEKGKVVDSSSKSYSIKVQLNSEEQWTKALKLMLTNLKWALAWVSAQCQESSDP